MLLIEESFSAENVFFYLRLLGKSLKEQKITILTSGYQYSLWRMSSDSGSKINTFIWKWGRTIDKTSHPHTAACGGCVLARCPPGSSLSAEGSKIWGYWTDSTDNHGLSAVPRRVPSEQRRARAGPGLPGAPSAEPVAVCPRDPPAEVWNWYSLRWHFVWARDYEFLSQ